MARKPQSRAKACPLPVPAPPVIPSIMIRGCRGRKPKNVIKFETRLGHWGLMKSFRIYFFKDGKPTADLVMKDLGVKLYGEEIRLQILTFDHSQTETPADRYEVSVDFDFLGQELGISWPQPKTRRK